jgi:hypothetical protein
MLWLIQNVIFSISLIVIIHYLYLYFETTLTAPKVKDLIHCPKQKYKSLFDTINKNLDNTKGSASGSASGSDSTANHLLKHNNQTDDYSFDLGKKYDDTTGSNQLNDMKSDLKTFLRGIGLKTKSNTNDSFRASYEMS